MSLLCCTRSLCSVTFRCTRARAHTRARTHTTHTHAHARTHARTHAHRTHACRPSPTPCSSAASPGTWQRPGAPLKICVLTPPPKKKHSHPTHPLRIFCGWTQVCPSATVVHRRARVTSCFGYARTHAHARTHARTRMHAHARAHARHPHIRAYICIHTRARRNLEFEDPLPIKYDANGDPTVISHVISVQRCYIYMYIYIYIIWFDKPSTHT